MNYDRHTIIIIMMVFFALFCLSKCITSPPIWKKSQFAQADVLLMHNGVNAMSSINNATSPLPTVTKTFVGSFSQIPNLAFGISAYSGGDMMTEEYFQITRVGLTTSSLTISVQLLGLDTNIYYLQIRFIAIDKLFPYHLNCFENVPVNYGSGPILTNVSTLSLTSQNYVNTIDYSLQATSVGSSYTSFNTTLTDYKFAAFITAIHIQGGTNDAAGPPFYPLNLEININAVSLTTYTVNVTYSQNSMLTQLHLSLIIFDEISVQSSGYFMLIFQKICFDQNGGLFFFQAQFKNNLIFGLVEFSTNKTAATLQYQNLFGALNGQYNLQISQLAPLAPNDPLSRVCFNLFYFKTWKCSGTLFFDPMTNMCTDCLLSMCPICGDSVILSPETCDDGNSINGDGCSSTCGIENYWTCNALLPSVCTRTTFINSSFISIQKQECNSFQIILQIDNYNLGNIWQDIIILNSGIKITAINDKSPEYEIIAQYSRDISNQTIQVYFTPGALYSVVYNPTPPALYYSNSQCQTPDKIQKLVLAMQIISYAVLIVSILSCKIVGIQLFGVLQISYFTLSSHNFFNIYLAPLTKFKSFNGLNLLLMKQYENVPQNLQLMQVNSSFLNNFNIMMFLMFAYLIISLILYKVSKITDKQKLNKISLHMLKQGFITLILFNIFNISFSTGIHLKYASILDSTYYIGYFAAVLCFFIVFGSVIAMQLTNPQQYGQFKKKFKKVWICKSYIPLTILYRVILGFYTGVQSQQLNTLIIISFSIVFMMYVLVNLPFYNVYQNYRCVLIHFTMLYILLTTNFYRSMKSNTSLDIKARIYFPAILQLILMIACIVVSILVLGNQIYTAVKQHMAKRKLQDQQKDESKNKTNEFNETIQQIK